MGKPRLCSMLAVFNDDGLEGGGEGGGRGRWGRGGGWCGKRRDEVAVTTMHCIAWPTMILSLALPLGAAGPVNLGQVSREVCKSLSVRLGCMAAVHAAACLLAHMPVYTSCLLEGSGTAAMCRWSPLWCGSMQRWFIGYKLLCKG